MRNAIKTEFKPFWIFDQQIYSNGSFSMSSYGLLSTFLLNFILWLSQKNLTFRGFYFEGSFDYDFVVRVIKHLAVYLLKNEYTVAP